MFWHGDSLVTSRVKKGTLQSQCSLRGRATLVNLIMFWVMTDITGAWTAAFTGNQIVFALIRLWIHCGSSALGKPDFVGQLILLAFHYTMRPHKVGEEDRFSPLALLPCCAGFLRRDACSPQFVPLPLLYPGILSSIRSSFHLFLKRVLPLTG